MSSETVRSTVYLDPALHRALRLKAAAASFKKSRSLASASRTQRVNNAGLTPTSRAIFRQLDFDRRTRPTSACLYSGL